MVNHRGQRLGSTGPCGPDLWADEFDQTNIRRLQADPLGYSQHEAPGIDQDNDVWLVGDDGFGRRIREPDNISVGFQAFKEPQNRQGADIYCGFDPDRCQLTSANSGDVYIRQAFADIFNHFSRHQVTGRFSSNHIDAGRGHFPISGSKP